MVRKLRQRKVLMVLESNYPTEGGGGAEGQVRTISRYLRDHGVAVQIITPMTRSAPRIVNDEIDGVPVWRIPYPQVRFIGGMLMLGRLAAFLLRRRGDYDVIHAHIAHNMAAVSSVVGRLLGKTVIVKLTGWLELKRGILAPGRNPFMAAKRMALQCAHHVQATSTQIRSRLIERGFRPECVHVIPNAVDVRRFATAAQVSDDDDANRAEPRTGIYVGRLVPEKGLDDLIDAWIAAFRPDADIRLLMIGDGALHEELAERIRRHGREHQLQLLGPRRDVESWLARANFGVLPSLYEGLSNTLLEYMAAGLPVLGTRVSGTEDFIAHGECGWLVEPGDSEGMTTCLEEIGSLASDDLHRMGAAARQMVTARAGIDAIVAKLAELYDMTAVLDGAGRREYV